MGGNSSVEINGNAGSNLIIRNSGDNTITGFAGNDTLNGGGGADTLEGRSGNNALNGGGGNDTLNGLAGNDALNGGGGNDTLEGRSGNDTLNGGAGNDTLSGNGSNDVFVFTGAFGNDVITDFEATNANEDIDLSGVASIFGINDLINNHMSQVGSNVVIDDLGGNTITLQNVNIADLDASDFIF
ncbi:MAG: calcium-binding protein [Pseudomonadota bacterium]